ncbi:MAG: hypothetical protein WBA10_16645 [Elainellaceae cyanobacterium]
MGSRTRAGDILTCCADIIGLLFVKPLAAYYFQIGMVSPDVFGNVIREQLSFFEEVCY